MTIRNYSSRAQQTTLSTGINASATSMTVGNASNLLGGVAGAIGGPFAPATVPAGMTLGASAGFATGMAKWMYQAMAGESYRQLREAEVPHDVAVSTSRAVGGITAALEFAGLGVEVWIASGVGKKAFAKEVATEVNAKLLQDLTKRAIHHIQSLRRVAAQTLALFHTTHQHLHDRELCESVASSFV